ncbi:cyclin-A1 [Protopterus annectens]|uniref:cyclin-A1 n=1 Tax=Protopterus annectens TaxID=7888 RepID=UPI001CF98CAE|nr:cyclin-A1 [Protopterus annectens]XP_043929237.1 cyclin-A1 [Protopterus annectens]
MLRNNSYLVSNKAMPAYLQSSEFYKNSAPILGEHRISQAPARSVLGVLNANEQYRQPCKQETVGYKFTSHTSGLQNVRAFGKSTLSNASNHVPAFPAKPAFLIYEDESEEEKENSFSSTTTERETKVNDVELHSVKQGFSLVLDLSEGSPMSVDTSLQSLSEDMECPVDVLAVTEYADDIYWYLRDAEMKSRPKVAYMRKQTDITDSMRTILVDWLVEVGEEYKLRRETLHLAVNYLDRFLSFMSVLRGKLQLVGTAAILLASKFEEIYPPEVDEFVYITDDAYTKQQLLKMEHLLLKVLTFDLAVPTVNQFLASYLMRQEVCSKTENLTMYIAELSLLETDPFLKYVPSVTAAAAYCLANYMVNGAFWPDSLATFTGYSLSEIAPCLSDLHKACLNAPHQTQRAIWEKYKTSKYMSVSLMEAPTFLPI